MSTAFILYRNHILTILPQQNGGVAIEITTEYDTRPVRTQNHATLAGALEAARNYVDRKFRVLH